MLTNASGWSEQGRHVCRRGAFNVAVLGWLPCGLFFLLAALSVKRDEAAMQARPCPLCCTVCTCTSPPHTLCRRCRASLSVCMAQIRLQAAGRVAAARLPQSEGDEAFAPSPAVVSPMKSWGSGPSAERPQPHSTHERDVDVERASPRKHHHVH